MPLTDQEIRALTYLAERCRPHGAPHWDATGIFAAIAKVRQMNLADVALSVIRAADDEHAKTPAVIANTRAPNWQERRDAGDRPQPRSYDLGAYCGVCDLPERDTRARHGEDHDWQPPAPKGSDNKPYIDQARAAIKAAREARDA